MIFLLLSLLLFSPPDGNGQQSTDESLFSIPKGLEESVSFWKQIFTVYSSSQLVFFDPLSPMRIYSIVDLATEKNLRQIIKNEQRKIIATDGVDEERVRVQRGIKDRFQEGLARSGQYIDQIKQIFREQGLPTELSYLPLVESSFNIHARSSAGAVGLWQFMRSTGKRFLRIDRHIDERKDPLESSRAAALLLKENYEILGSWPLALTAYNHGQEGLNRAVAKVGSQDLVDLIRSYESRTWGFASKNFYAEFLAALDVASHVEQYFPDFEFHPPFQLEELELEKSTTLAALLKSTGLPRNQLLEWNPALSSRITIVPQGYRVKVSTNMLAPIKEAHNALPELSTIRHRVKRGETLSQIARRYDASVDEIQQINGLQKAHVINIGQVLLIPTQ